jgi:dTDP-4-amino-4,6-dideoxygalactose transaminase
LRIPLVDLKGQYGSIKAEIDEAIARVLQSTEFILGEEVERFENAFADYCEVKHAIGLSSGTDALHLALVACGVGPGDEVIAPTFTFIATAEAISMCGATPVFVDVDADTLNMDPSLFQGAITEKTRAVIPVHLYGQPAEMESILQIARANNLYVIEDAAQAHGARFRGTRAGTLGDIGCFSFYPGKNLGAYGDGGAVVTNRDGPAGRIRMLRNHGRREKYEHLEVGYGNRLDAIQAAILNAKLPHLDDWIRARVRIARWYDEALADLGDLTLPHVTEQTDPAWHLYVIRCRDREAYRVGLRERGITTGIHYPIPLHLQPAYAHLGYVHGDFPVSEAAATQVLSLPIYPEMNEAQLEQVSAGILDVSAGIAQQTT